jgi:hypothetical protein
LGDVTGVFFGRDFISVTAAPGVEWRDLKPDVLGILLDHFSANMPLFHAGTAAASRCRPRAPISATIPRMPRSSRRSAS